MRTPITYYGGKQLLAEKIISMMPAHKIYCEPFFGGGAVFFAKPKSYLEVINDKNDRLINFYQTVQLKFDDIQKLIAGSLHSEREYLQAKDFYNGRKPCDEIQLAWAVWVITNGSFSASMHGGWKWCNGSAGSHSGVFMRNKRNEFNDVLRIRLQDVQISCRDAIDVIRPRDTPDTLFYLDPPYPGCTQGHYRGYSHRDLYELLKLLSTIKGKFILSNFWCQTLRYFVLANKWNTISLDMPLKVANLTKAKRKTEIIITNFNQEPSLFDNLKNKYNDVQNSNI